MQFQCQQRLVSFDVQWKNGSKWLVPSSCCDPKSSVTLCQDEARSGIVVNGTKYLYCHVLTLCFTILTALLQLNIVDHDVH